MGRMDTKDIFKQAFSQLGGNYSCPDHETAFNDVLERAKNMKKDDNVRQMQFTEITPEYIEPKKSHKAISVVAGIAGAAAVLTGAVFGLNWLNEHGGLKEGGIESINGAGYHEDITTPLSADMRENVDNANILATFVYDDFTVNITGYDFDGISLKVYYDTIFPDDCTLSSGERIASVLPIIKFAEENSSEGYGELISETENTQSCIFRETLEEYTESLKVDFKPNKQGYAGSGGYPYTVYADHKKPEPIEIDAVGKAVNGVVPMDETIELDGVKVHFTGYEFDSVSVKFYYDIKNNENGYRNSVRPINIGSKTFVPGHAGSLHDNSDLDDVLHCYAVFAVEGEPQTVRIPFGYAVFPEDFPAEPRTEEDELFAVVLHFDEESALRTFWGRNIAIDENGGRVKLRDGFITPTHIMVSVENSFGVPDDQIEKLTAAVKMKDGTRLVPHLDSFIVDPDSDTRWLIYEFDEPIDISEVEEGSFHNFYFYGEDWEETKRMIDNYEKIRDIESSPLYTPADEWFDCDGKRVHVTGYAFDTVNLRIRYETCYDYSVKGLDAYYNVPNRFPNGSASVFGGEIHEERADEGIVEMLVTCIADEPTDTLEVPFGDSYFTVSYNSVIPRIEREINKEVSGSVNYRFDRFVLTPYSLSIIVTDGPTDYATDEGVEFTHAVSDFEIAINLADGSTRKMRGLGDEPSGIAMPDGKAYKFYQFLDPIDINDVVTITVNGCEIYNCERALEIGKEFALADGSKGIVNSVQYDGHVCKAEMELRSTDPEYYEHKSYKSKDDPSYSIFLGAHSTITKECGSGKIEITSDENGSVIKYTSFFVPLDKDDTLKLYIGDLTDHVERRAGYVEVPLTIPRHDPIKIVTENDEFGRWEITLSPMGFVIEKDGSDFFLDPKNTDCIVVFTDGREETHTMLSTGHYDKYSSYEYTFGVFDAPLDLDNIQSVSLYGQTIVLGETSD